MIRVAIKILWNHWDRWIEDNFHDLWYHIPNIST